MLNLSRDPHRNKIRFNFMRSIDASGSADRTGFRNCDSRLHNVCDSRGEPFITYNIH